MPTGSRPTSPPSQEPGKHSGFALRFISGKYQGGEFPLRQGREVIIGRSSDLDMVLVEDMVSRKHAKIGAENGQIVIQDLGSTNGTFVNGEKIRRTVLKEGDRILIGTSIIKVITQDDKGIDEWDVKSNLEALGQRRQSPARAMSGSIEEVPLPDLLQLFSSNKKSGVLVVRGPGLGKIYLRNGAIFFASIDNNTETGPLKSIYRMLTWTRGTFEFLPPTGETFSEEIEGSTDGILMEGMRQMDELRRIEKDIPPIISTLTLQVPLTAQLRDLAAEQLDVLQLIVNYGQTITVLNKSRLTDLDTFQALIHLLRNNYIRVE